MRRLPLPSQPPAGPGAARPRGNPHGSPGSGRPGPRCGRSPLSAAAGGGGEEGGAHLPMASGRAEAEPRLPGLRTGKPRLGPRRAAHRQVTVLRRGSAVEFPHRQTLRYHPGGSPPPPTPLLPQSPPVGSASPRLASPHLTSGFSRPPPRSAGAGGRAGGAAPPLALTEGAAPSPGAAVCGAGLGPGSPAA